VASKLIVKTIPIIRMDCPTCIPVLEREIKKLEGVDNVRGNYMAKTLKVTYDPDRVQLTEIEAAIERVGYQIAYKKYTSVISRLKGIFQKEIKNTSFHIRH
jgi:Cu+-exporting ATPase